MTENELARKIFKKERAEQHRQAIATAVGADEDGMVQVVYDGETIWPEEMEDEYAYDVIPTSSSVYEGDTMIVTLIGETAIDSRAIGSGGRVYERTVTLEERTDEVVVNIESVVASANDLSDRVTAAEEGITENANAIEEEVNTRSAYIRFTSDESGNPLIELGAEDSDLMLRLTNEQIGFLNGDELVAYITGQLLNISNAKVSQTLQFGDFAWIPRSNRNLALKWIGGDL